MNADHVLQVTKRCRCWSKAIMIRAVRRRHCVGGVAPVNFGRRRRAAGPKKSAEARQVKF